MNTDLLQLHAQVRAVVAKTKAKTWVEINNCLPNIPHSQLYQHLMQYLDILSMTSWCHYMFYQNRVPLILNDRTVRGGLIKCATFTCCTLARPAFTCRTLARLASVTQVEDGYRCQNSHHGSNHLHHICNQTACHCKAVCRSGSALAHGTHVRRVPDDRAVTQKQCNPIGM